MKDGRQIDWIGRSSDQLVDSIFDGRIVQELGPNSVQGGRCELGSMGFHLLPVRFGGCPTLHLINLIKVRFPVDVAHDLSDLTKANGLQHIPSL